MLYIFLYLSAALGISFLCSILEAVLLSTPISFISMKEAEGARSAALLKKQKLDIDKPISAILSLNTIAHTIGAAGVGAEAVKVFGEQWFGLISAILTILILVLSEIIPKTVGANHWRKLALPSARIIRILIIIAYPLVLLSELITRLISPRKKEVSVSREEVSAMVHVGEEEGVFQPKENRMIQNLMKFGNIHAREIMTPRVVAAIASENMTVREFYKNKAYEPYSRIPVYSERPEFITGYVLKQRVLECLTEDKFDVRLKDIAREALFFQEEDPVSQIWDQLLARKEQISLIIDEYGCFEGIVTMEDIIETLLGLEIIDEKDTVVDLQKLARERWAKKQNKMSSGSGSEIRE